MAGEGGFKRYKRLYADLGSRPQDDGWVGPLCDGPPSFVLLQQPKETYPPLGGRRRKKKAAGKPILLFWSLIQR